MTYQGHFDQAGMALADLLNVCVALVAHHYKVSPAGPQLLDDAARTAGKAGTMGSTQHTHAAGRHRRGGYGWSVLHLEGCRWREAHQELPPPTIHKCYALGCSSHRSLARTPIECTARFKPLHPNHRLAQAASNSQPPPLWPAMPPVIFDCQTSTHPCRPHA